MDPRQLLRPLPLMVASLFVIAAAVDFVHHSSSPPVELPHLLADASLSFRAVEPVFDFRDRGAANPLGEGPELSATGWSPPDAQGTWITGHRAGFEVELVDDGFAAVALECRSSRGPAAADRLTIVVNGVDCGEIHLGRAWATVPLELPRGALVAGRNRIQIGRPKGVTGSDTERVALIRRVGFLRGLRDVDSHPRLVLPASADRARDTVVLRGSGRLDVVFEMHEMVDALIVGYRFDRPLGRLEVVVTKTVEGRHGGGPSLRRELSAEERRSGRVRIPLHGRRGSYVLTIRAALGTPPSELVLKPLRFVNEG